MKHSVIAPGFIHTPFNWVFATAADRTAASFDPADVLKIAFDEDTGDGWVLTAVDGGGVGTWEPLASSVLTLPVRAPVVSTGTAVAGAHGPVDATSANITRNLPTGVGAGTLISIEKLDSSTHTVTVAGNIRGTPAQSIVLLLAHESIMLITDASGSWWPVAGHKTLSSLDARYQAKPIATGDLPASVLLDARGSAAEDLLKFNGSSFVRVPKGTTGQQLTVRSDGTVQYTTKPWINVADYGILPDGAGAYSAQMASLIGSVAAFGRTLYWPAGVYTYDPSVGGGPLDPSANGGDQTWIGEGWINTRLNLIAQATQPLISTSLSRKWHVRKMGFSSQFDGAPAHYTTPPAYLVYNACQLCYWEDVGVFYSPSDGLWVGFTGTTDGVNGDANTHTRLHVLSCYGHGVVAASTHTFQDCDIEYNMRDGLRLPNTPTPSMVGSRIVVKGSHFEGNGENNLYADNVGALEFVGNSSHQAPIHLSSRTHHAKVTGNQLVASPVIDNGWMNEVMPNDGQREASFLRAPSERLLPGSRIVDPDQSWRTTFTNNWQPLGGSAAVRLDEFSTLRMFSRTARVPVQITGAAGKGATSTVIGLTAGEVYAFDVFWWVNALGTRQAVDIQVLDSGSSAVLFDSGTILGATYSGAEWVDNRYRFVWTVPAGTTGIKLQLTCPDTLPGLYPGLARMMLLGPTAGGYVNGSFDGVFASGIAPGWASLAGAGTATQETGIVHSGATVGGSAQRIAVASGGSFYLSCAPTLDPDRLYLLMCSIYTVTGAPSRALVGFGNNSLVSQTQVARANRKVGEWETVSCVFRPGGDPNLIIGVNGAALSTGNVYGGAEVNTNTAGRGSIGAQAVDAIFDDLSFLPLHEHPGVYRAESAEMALSTATTTVIPLAHALDMRLRRISIIYTVATDANAGVNVRVGNNISDSYYMSRTSDVSQAQGTEITVQPSRTDIRVGQPILLKVSAAKTGTGSIKVVVEAEAN